MAKTHDDKGPWRAKPRPTMAEKKPTKRGDETHDSEGKKREGHGQNHLKILHLKTPPPKSPHNQRQRQGGWWGPWPRWLFTIPLPPSSFLQFCPPIFLSIFLYIKKETYFLIKFKRCSHLYLTEMHSTLSKFDQFWFCSLMFSNLIHSLFIMVHLYFSPPV